MTDEAAQAYEDYLIKQAQEESLRLQVELPVPCVCLSIFVSVQFACNCKGLNIASDVLNSLKTMPVIRTGLLSPPVLMHGGLL